MDKKPEALSRKDLIESQLENLRKELKTARSAWTFLITNPINWPFPDVNLENSTYKDWNQVWERYFEAEKRYRVKEHNTEEEIKRLEKLLKDKNHGEEI